MPRKPLLLLACFLLALTASCNEAGRQGQPVTLTMWHVFGCLSDSPMNELVEHFNATAGKEQGISINVTGLSNSTAIHFALLDAARGKPGAGEMPDIFVTYPKTIHDLGAKRVVDWRRLLTERELGSYVPEFLCDGVIDGRQALLPIVKSTSALFINGSTFERFSRDTGIAAEDLATWEGMFRAAATYHAWSGGKAFFMHDDWIHFSLLNTQALGGCLVRDGKMNFDDPAFARVWKALAKAAVQGHVCLNDGYTTTSMMTGAAIAGIESTASILYYKDEVTLPDNRKEPLKLLVLPTPRFEGAEPLDLLRGGDLAVTCSTREKEEAAAAFVKWLTAPENNIPFAIATGYLPVMKQSYASLSRPGERKIEDPKAQTLYGSLGPHLPAMRFWSPPYSAGYGDLEKRFHANELSIFRAYRKAYDGSTSPDILAERMFEDFRRAMESR